MVEPSVVVVSCGHDETFLEPHFLRRSPRVRPSGAGAEHPIVQAVPVILEYSIGDEEPFTSSLGGGFYPADHDSVKPEPVVAHQPRKARSPVKRVLKKATRLRCDYCSYSTVRAKTLELHERSHTNERPYDCEICAKAFVSEKQLEIHIRKTHGQEKNHQCDYCELRFGYSSHLNRHVKSYHAEMLPVELATATYSCRYCERPFGRSDVRNRHEKANICQKTVNRNQRFDGEFQCFRCPFSTNIKSQLVNHQKVHSELMNHLCSYCGMRFKCARYVKRHEIVVHERRRPFKCSWCTTTFVSRLDRSRHLTNVHVMEPDDQATSSSSSSDSDSNSETLYSRDTSSRASSRATSKSTSRKSSRRRKPIFTPLAKVDDVISKSVELDALSRAVPPQLFDSMIENAIDEDNVFASVTEDGQEVSYGASPSGATLAVTGNDDLYEYQYYDEGAIYDSGNGGGPQDHTGTTDDRPVTLYQCQMCAFVTDSDNLDQFGTHVCNAPPAAVDQRQDEESSDRELIIALMPDSDNPDTEWSACSASEPVITSSVQSPLRKSQRVATEAGRYRCVNEDCVGICFSTRSHLVRHEKTMHGNCGGCLKEGQLAELYFCRHCLKSFVRNDMRLRHERSETCLKQNTSRKFSPCNLAKHRCGQCAYSTDHRSKLKYHLATHSADRSHVCPVCCQRFKTERYLHRHEKLKHGGDESTNNYECAICSMRFHTRSVLVAHGKREHNVSDVECFNENVASEKPRLAAKRPRRVSKRPKTEMEVTIPVVDILKTSMSAAELLLDSAVESNYGRNSDYEDISSDDDNEERSSADEYQCSLCDYSTPYYGHFSNHRNQHLGLKPYPCLVCDETFARATARKKHLKKVHQIIESYSCKDRHCNLCFATLSQLRTHRREVHSELAQTITSDAKSKNISYGMCSRCGKEFKNRAEKRRHPNSKMCRRDYSQRRYQCSKCLYGANSKQQIINHEKLHSNERPFVCFQCGRAFILDRYLRRHISLVHLKEKNFKCGQCQKEFAEKYGLKRHEEVVHHVKRSPPRSKAVAMAAVEVLTTSETESVLTESSNHQETATTSKLVARRGRYRRRESGADASCSESIVTADGLGLVLTSESEIEVGRDASNFRPFPRRPFGKRVQVRYIADGEFLRPTSGSEFTEMHSGSEASTSVRSGNTLDYQAAMDALVSPMSEKIGIRTNNDPMLSDTGIEPSTPCTPMTRARRLLLDTPTAGSVAATISSNTVGYLSDDVTMAIDAASSSFDEDSVILNLRIDESDATGSEL